MPVLDKINVEVPAWQFNGHLQTIVPNMMRKVEGVQYIRERIHTWDNDFLDLDWSVKGHDKLVILSHGLAGNSAAGYIKGLVKAFNENGFDALAWNFRGCSGEPNKNLYSFHGGKTDDLDWVIQYVIQNKAYKRIDLIGISMGGNVTLKLLGEYGENVPSPIKKAVAISVPVDMFSTSFHLVKGWNLMYSNRYMRQYKEMLKEKEKLFQGSWDFEKAYKAENLHSFVEYFTAPSFGFQNAEQYLKTQSAIHFLEHIKIPTLLLNADNDPFLTKSSYPFNTAKQSDFLHLQVTLNGGHVGFDEKQKSQYNFMERTSLSFMDA